MRGQNGEDRAEDQVADEVLQVRVQGQGGDRAPPLAFEDALRVHLSRIPPVRIRQSVPTDRVDGDQRDPVDDGAGVTARADAQLLALRRPVDVLVLVQPELTKGGRRMLARDQQREIAFEPLDRVRDAQRLEDQSSLLAGFLLS